jgi:hypothetical protein
MQTSDLPIALGALGVTDDLVEEAALTGDVIGPELFGQRQHANYAVLIPFAGQSPWPPTFGQGRSKVATDGYQ